MNKYKNEIVERKDVTVENMFKLHSNCTKFKNKITWDNYYLVTGWKYVQKGKDERQK